VHQPRGEPLEELALAEDDLSLVADPRRNVAGAFGGAAQLDEVREQLDAAPEQETADGQRRGERERSGQDVYDPRAFRSSAVIAGTISARSPITA
jgi:hypothetical protein